MLIDKESDCEDIGYAYVNVNDILNMNENYIDRELDRKFTWNDVNPLFHIVAHILKILNEYYSWLKKKVQKLSFFWL